MEETFKSTVGKDKVPFVPDAPETDGCRPIHTACTNGRLDEVKKILSEGGESPINARTASGDTPLMCAVFNGHLEVAKLLLQEVNVEVFSENNAGRTALDLAYETCSFHIAALLVDLYLGCFEHQTICEAAKHNDLHSLRLCLYYKEQSPSEVDDEGKTPLMHALASEDQEAALPLARFLLDIPGIDISKRDQNGRTALMMACCNPSCPVELVKSLVARRDTLINAVDQEGNTALLLCVKEDRREFIEALCCEQRAFEITANVVNEEGQGIEELSTEFGFPDLPAFIKGLLPRGALRRPVPEEEEEEEVNEEDV